MAEKNGNSISWAKLGTAAAGLVVLLIVYIWQTSVPPATIPILERLSKSDSVQVARLSWLENQRLVDSIYKDRTTALLVQVTQMLNERLPQAGPRR